MVDLDRLRIRFRQFGGWRLAWEYVRMGLLWVIVREMLRCVVHGRSFKNIYPAIERVVDPMLVEKYAPKVHHQSSPLGREEEGEKRKEEGEKAEDKRYVWSCWLQGWDKAPELAKACLASLKRNLVDVEIVEIDGENYTEWVSLPDYVVEKYRKGRIPHAMFSDMLRLQLLAEHGGVWIDSTVLYTNNERGERTESASGVNAKGANDMAYSFSPSWEEIVKADLFVFQYTKPGYRWSGNISNWFIASKKGNPFILTLRDMLFAYWKDYDVALEYYICHLFFGEVAKIYPEQIAAMPYGWSVPSISLGGHLGEAFDEKKWAQFTSRVHWHKMTYRHTEKAKETEGSYYNYIIKEYEVDKY